MLSLQALISAFWTTDPSFVSSMNDEEVLRHEDETESLHVCPVYTRLSGSDVLTCVQRRRECGKMAQRKFCNRQKDAIQKLHNENAQLKRIIAKLSRACDRRSLSQMLHLLDDAARVAGVDTSNPSTANAEFLVKPPPIELATGLDGMRENGAGDWPGESEDLPLFSERITSGKIPSLRFDYAFLFDSARLARVVTTLVDIVPYLGSGLNTFAGRLHWACISLCHEMCNNCTSSPILGPRSQPNLLQMLQHSHPLHNIRYIGAIGSSTGIPRAGIR